MSIDSHGARLTRRDVTELATASEQLAVVAQTIRSGGVKWGEAAVNLLIAANTTIERIQNKGAAVFARYLAKHGQQSPAEPPEVEIVTDDVRHERNVTPGEPEEE